MLKFDKAHMATAMLLACELLGLVSSPAVAADRGQVQAGGRPAAGSTVSLWAASAEVLLLQRRFIKLLPPKPTWTEFARIVLVGSAAV
jgi:hypothetical protein